MLPVDYDYVIQSAKGPWFEDFKLFYLKWFSTIKL